MKQEYSVRKKNAAPRGGTEQNGYRINYLADLFFGATPQRSGGAVSKIGYRFQDKISAFQLIKFITSFVCGNIIHCTIV